MLVGAVEYALLSKDNIEPAVEAFDGLETWIPCRLLSNV